MPENQKNIQAYNRDQGPITPQDRTGRLYHIPAGSGFAAALVKGILTENKELYGNDPLALTRMRVLLPTRRGCRVVRDMFLQQTAGLGDAKADALLLPRLQTLGDQDEEELALQLRTPEDFAEFAAIRPAIPATKRRLMLARMVQEREKTLAFGQAVGLADSLARLLDQTETEGRSLGNLATLVPEGDLAAHWQEIVKFLEIISIVWPTVLEAEGYISAATRRDKLLRLQARLWEENPPPERIIAAGSTGSLPGTAALLQTIARLPQGAVILPALDTDMPDTAWDALEEGHPQATLKNLLQTLGVPRGDVHLWNAAANENEKCSIKARRQLLSTLMLPAAETHRWTDISAEKDEFLQPEALQELQQNLSVIACESPEEEARLVALALRQTAEQPDKVAALITPDRNLARRVAMACRRWGIEVDDSAGIPLGDSPLGRYLLLIAEACSRQLVAGPLLALLQHDFCGLGVHQGERERLVALLDRYILRGPRFSAGPTGLRHKLDEILQGHHVPPLVREHGDSLHRLIDGIETALSPLLQNPLPQGVALVKALITAAENLADAPAIAGPERLWRGDTGETASVFLSDLIAHADTLPEINLAEFCEFLERTMAGIPVRTPVGVHPRLLILGQLEARLVQPDVMIMAGLNEGTWPPNPADDPWMSRPMRQKFGLPTPERSITLAAHDFSQCFCAPRVIMTRAQSVDGKPTIPSRWLQRLATVLQAAHLPADFLYQEEARTLLGLARQGDIARDIAPAARPQPCPPEQYRLQQISITQIETLMNNPYAIYARDILKLPKLDPVDKAVGAAERGNFVHDVLQDFITLHREQLPPEPVKTITDLGYRRRQALAEDKGSWDYWWPRFESLAFSFVDQEENWRTEARNVALESKAQIELTIGNKTIKLKGRADRIDRMSDGTYAIIDYKTGGTYSPKKIEQGLQPQLPLEAFVLQKGGFADIRGTVGYIGYWKLAGGHKGCETVALSGTDKLSDLIENTEINLCTLLEAYSDPATPFTCRPRPDLQPRFDDYKLLSRLDEWTHDDTGAEEDVA